MSGGAVTFFVPGRPFSKKRARSGMGRTYTPAETVAAEAAVRTYARRAFGDRPPLAGPVSLSCRFVFAPTARARVEAGGWHVAPGDADNYLKLVSDALNPHPDWAGAWGDDRQVAVLGATKTWAAEGDPEGTTVVLEELRA